MIEFLCPNGHKIHCPQQQAGRAAKCPRCGVKFRIPDPSELAEHVGGDADSDVLRPELTDSDVGQSASGIRAGSASSDSKIEFLCPNGHRLHGPSRLQGHPGQCPECGSKFRIPTYAEAPPDEEAELEISLAGAGEPGTSALLTDEVEQITETDFADQSPHAGRPARAAAIGRSAPSVASHPLAQWFAKLWADKPPGATIELHFGNGDRLVPEKFAKSSSPADYGLFAVKEPDGKYTLNAVAWGSIVRVLVRGVDELPQGMVE